MTGQPKRFDWSAFFVRVFVIATLATWSLIKMARNHDRLGVLLVAGIGYVILPALAYLQTRYYNLMFNFGISEAVRRRFARRSKDRST
jgi:hypothetical protein